MVPSGAFAEARAFVLQYAFQIAEITATVLPFLLLFGAFFSAIQMVNNWEELAESAALDSWQERIEEEWRHMGDADEN
ncbi:hypothetical protein A2619_00430 [candidate division WWE3 bacterium RIFOXYD1_FULL_39_9]|nr:MAG: hypothetical protein A2619_00430 [candidate division WWE3 bacterium RIFOXYD1_FULL_39_9]